MNSNKTEIHTFPLNEIHHPYWVGELVLSAWGTRISKTKFCKWNNSESLKKEMETRSVGKQLTQLLLEWQTLSSSNDFQTLFPTFSNNDHNNNQEQNDPLLMSNLAKNSELSNETSEDLTTTKQENAEDVIDFPQEYSSKKKFIRRPRRAKTVSEITFQNEPIIDTGPSTSLTFKMKFCFLLLKLLLPKNNINLLLRLVTILND